jgi:RimJ/RimL family protein N-acetyltransferase
MKHNLILTGLAFRLRPICDDDAEFVVGLRTNPKLNQYLHAISGDRGDQLAWMREYYKRPDDYYFVVETKDTAAPEGVISVYDVHTRDACAEWGRWVLRPGSMAAVESAWLVYRVAFELLGLERVYCRTVAENRAVVSFHDSCCIPIRRLLPGHFNLDGLRLDAVEHTLDRRAWEAINPRLRNLAQLLARKLRCD